MVTEKDVEHLAGLADIGINTDELGTFTGQFNAILDYFDLLDRVKGDAVVTRDLTNIMREDEITPSLARDDILTNAGAHEDGFIRAPRVM